MNEKILCPYCGSEMVDSLAVYYMYCPACGSKSPKCGAGKEAVHRAALHRFSPMQKPLTPEEASNIVYGETDKPPMVYFECRENPCENSYADAKLFFRIITIMCGTFNSKWRLWATKPTDEERQAAKWEES